MGVAVAGGAAGGGAAPIPPPTLSELCMHGVSSNPSPLMWSVALGRVTALRDMLERCGGGLDFQWARTLLVSLRKRDAAEARERAVAAGATVTAEDSDEEGDDGGYIGLAVGGKKHAAWARDLQSRLVRVTV
jgi:hypothetical protein